METIILNFYFLRNAVNTSELAMQSMKQKNEAIKSKNCARDRSFTKEKEEVNVRETQDAGGRRIFSSAKTVLEADKQETKIIQVKKTVLFTM